MSAVLERGPLPGGGGHVDPPLSVQGEEKRRERREEITERTPLGLCLPSGAPSPPPASASRLPFHPPAAAPAIPATRHTVAGSPAAGLAPRQANAWGRRASILLGND